LVISAPENDRENVYVKEARLNGKRLDVNYVRHEQLTAGGTLKFTMSREPERERGVSRLSRPYSMSSQKE